MKRKNAPGGRRVGKRNTYPDQVEWVFVAASSPEGKHILANANATMYFDGWTHAYIERGNKRICVPLCEA